MSDFDSNRVTITSPPTPGTQDVSIVSSIELEVKNDVGNPLSIEGTVSIEPATTATVTMVTVSTSPTLLLGANALRKGFAVQNQQQVVFVKFDVTASTSLYSYELPRRGILEKDNYTGPVTAVVSTGTVDVMVTELV